MVRLAGLASRDLYGNSFHVLYVRNEPGVFLLLILALILARRYLFSDKFSSSWPAPVGRDWLVSFPWLWIIALSVVLIAWLGASLVLHGFPLSNDEFLPRFQAQIFAAGQLKAQLPPALREFAKALAPVFAAFNPREGTWISTYLPIHAALQTVFLSLGSESLTSPVLAGLSLVLIAAAARRLWPEEALAPFLAVVLLASSSQFLVTSMTTYAYPAHLLFNLAWLYFYARRDLLGYLVTPWIGFFALGLHNPFVHALFVAPFLLALVWQRHWRLTLYFGAVYAGACLVWYWWWTRVVLFQGSDLSAFRLPGFYQVLIQPMNLSMFFAWQSLALTVPLLMALFYWRRLALVLKLLTFGCLLTYGFFFFYPLDQVLGWGYRFLYGVLGNLVLVAVAGWFQLRDSLGVRKAWGFFVLATAVALLVQFPLRCLQVESFIRPFARSARYIQSLPDDYVVVDPSQVWFAQLLMRNDPFLRNHPRVLFAQYLTPEQLAALSSLGTVHLLQPQELGRCGLHPIQPRHDSPRD